MGTYFVSTTIETSTSGDDAYDLANPDDSLLVTSSGALIALNFNDGIDASASGQGVVVDGLAYSSYGFGIVLSGQDSFLVLNGQAFGGNAGVLAGGLGQSITVDGVAQGNYGVEISNGSISVFIDGKAQGSAGGAGINQAIGIGDIINIDKTGEVTGGTGVLLNGFLDEAVTNDGSITGIAYGIAAYETPGDAIVNDGVISSSGPSEDGDAFYLVDDTDTIIHNAGLISGGTAFLLQTGSTAIIENTGTIQGGLVVQDTSSVDIENAGIWQSADQGLVLQSSGNNTLTNSGTIHGSIYMGTGSDTIVNSGKIVGSISFGGAASLTNDGQIHGAVSMGVGDTLTNTGTIYGRVSLAANDTVDTNRGEITGTVTAAASDTFNFSGEFGHNVILGFATASTTHDTINFLSDDFSSYTELQAHMAQVGNDVVITLDAADTIVLEHITLAHLTTHDFTFG